MTNFKTSWCGWPSLSCQRVLVLLHGFTVELSELENGFIVEFSELEKQQEAEPEGEFWNWMLEKL